MNKFHLILKELIMIAEVTAAIVGIIKFKKFRNSYWKWFICYLIFIACSEIVCHFFLIKNTKFLGPYFGLFIIPLEFLVLFWLYGYKSLNNRKLFWVSVVVFLSSLIPYFFVKDRT